eukprot:SAG31_NODE_18499_length_633_cov_3.865169_1_plen_29_part_01
MLSCQYVGGTAVLCQSWYKMSYTTLDRNQ